METAAASQQPPVVPLSPVSHGVGEETAEDDSKPVVTTLRVGHSASEETAKWTREIRRMD